MANKKEKKKRAREKQGGKLRKRKPKKKEKILQEIAEKLKSSDLKIGKKELKKLREMNEQDFNQFVHQMHPSDASGILSDISGKSTTPVLERIAGEQERPRFVSTGRTRATPIFSESEEESSTYLSTNEQSEEEKYSPKGNKESGSERIYLTPQKVNPLQTRNVFQENTRQTNEDFFVHSNETDFGSRPIETIRTMPETVNIERAGRENLFKAQEKKYEKYDPDLPSSH